MGPTALIVLAGTCSAMLGRALAQWMQWPVIINIGIAVTCGALVCVGLLIVFKHPIADELSRLRRKS